MDWHVSASRRDWLLLGGCMGFLAVKLLLSVRSSLKEWRDEAEVIPVPPKPQYITQETEDALEQDTLNTLLGHHNYAIRETAAKIVCDRAMNDDSIIETLLVGITRPDYDERMRNLRALAMVTDHRSLEKLHTWKAYSALVRALELSIDPDQEELNSKYYDEYPLRDMAEKLGLMFVSQLISRFEADKLVKAGFVEKWLARQNWGDSEETKQANFSQYMVHRNNRIADIVNSIQRVKCGREALADAGLIPREWVDDSNTNGAQSATMGLGETNILFYTLNTAPRNRDQSVEEARVRHRNREAMVLNDGSGPVTSSDIILQTLRGQQQPEEEI